MVTITRAILTEMCQKRVGSSAGPAVELDRLAGQADGVQNEGDDVELHSISKAGILDVMKSGDSQSMPPALREMAAYWHGLRDGRLVPPRAEVDPRGLASAALPHAFIAERIAPGTARLRVCGAHLSDLMGMETAGMPLSAFILPEARHTFATALEQVFATPSIVEMSLKAERSLGRPALRARLVLYPLTDAKGDVVRALGCLMSDGRIGRAPRRFTIAHTRVQALGAPDYAMPADSPAGQMAEDAAPFKAAPHPKAPWLRLVKSDD